MNSDAVIYEIFEKLDAENVHKFSQNCSVSLKIKFRNMCCIFRRTIPLPPSSVSAPKILLINIFRQNFCFLKYEQLPCKNFFKNLENFWERLRKPL